MGLAGWVVDLLNSSGNVVASTSTNKLGNYSFTGVYPGNFVVEEVVETGWYQTTVPTTYSVSSTSGAAVTGLIFGDHKGTKPAMVLGGGSGVRAISIVPTTTTNLSVPSSYIGTGPSAVVVPGVSQPAPVNVVYNDSNIATKDQVIAAIAGLYDSHKKVAQEATIALLAKSLLGGWNLEH